MGRPSLHPSRRAPPAAVQPHGFPAAHARAMARAASAAQAQPQAAAAQLPPAPEEAPQAADTAMSAEGAIVCSMHRPLGSRGPLVDWEILCVHAGLAGEADVIVLVDLTTGTCLAAMQQVAVLGGCRAFLQQCML